MAQYVYKNDAGASLAINDDYQSATVSVFKTESAVNRTVFSTTVPNETGEFSAGFEAAGSQVGLRIKHNGSDYTYFPGANPPQYIGVACFRQLGGAGGVVPGYRIVAVNSNTEDAVINLIHSGGFNYNNYVVQWVSEEDAEESIEADYAWDEPPSTNPDDINNVDPSGGEYADTDDFFDSDDIIPNDFPLPDAIDYGKFLTCYMLDSGDLNTLGDNLFFADFWATLRNKFDGLTDPLSCVMRCHELPIKPSYIGRVSADFALGGDKLYVDGNPVSVHKAVVRFQNVSCGSIAVKEVWGSAKDYSDVDISIFLPFVGVKQLDPDLIVGNTIELLCRFDVWTGDIVYLLYQNNADIGGKYYKQSALIYRFTGNCASDVPIGRVDNSKAILGVISGIVGIAGGVAMAGVGGAALAAKGAAGAGAAGASLGISAGVNTVDKSLGMIGEGFRPIINTSGSVAGAPGLMDMQTPYLIIKRGVPEYPINWRHQIGAPRNQNLPVSGLHGFTKFSDIYIENLGIAVKEEIEEARRLLCTAGIIL